MRGTTNFSQRSVKKKKPLRFQRFTNFAFLLTILVVFLFMMSAAIKNIWIGFELMKEKRILLENQSMVVELEKQLEYSKTPVFIEHYARENLDMLKSGEFVILLKNE